MKKRIRVELTFENFCQAQAVGVCRAVMQHFPLDRERLLSASDAQVSYINKV